MEQKTKVVAEAEQQFLTITREFDLPVELLFRAYAEKELLEEWMNTKVLKFEPETQGAWTIETSDPSGQLAFRAHGVFHEWIPNQKIVRTFEMENSGFDVQLEFLDFTPLGDEKSKLEMRVIYKTPEHRDKMLKLPFSFGINKAHDRIQEILKTKS